MNYKDLSEEKRKEIKKEFLETGKTDIYRKANRIFIMAVFGACFAIVAMGVNIYTGGNTLNYVLDIFLLIFTLYFIFRTSIIKQLEFEKFIVQKSQANKSKETKSPKKKK